MYRNNLYTYLSYQIPPNFLARNTFQVTHLRNLNNFNLFAQYSPMAYSLVSKTKSSIYTRFTLSWKIVGNLSLQAGAENPLFCRQRDITWTSNPNYSSYSTFLNRGMKPYIFIGATFYFSNKIKSSRRNKKGP